MSPPRSIRRRIGAGVGLPLAVSLTAVLLTGCGRDPITDSQEGQSPRPVPDVISYNPQFPSPVPTAEPFAEAPLEAPPSAESTPS